MKFTYEILDMDKLEEINDDEYSRFEFASEKCISSYFVHDDEICMEDQVHLMNTALRLAREGITHLTILRDYYNRQVEYLMPMSIEEVARKYKKWSES